MSYFIKAELWRLKIVSKIVLSRLPIPYSFWKCLHIFRHGDMDQPQRVLENFLMHARAAYVLDEESLLPHLKVSGDFNVLELGPGDSQCSILIAKALGATYTWLVDAGDFASKDLALYAEMLNMLAQRGYSLPFLDEDKPNTLIDIIKACNGKYLTDGIQSLAQVPSRTVDFIFSQTVLQHIPKSDFNQAAEHLFRILKPNGVCHHRVDLKDMMGGGLNNLRFSDVVWESPLFRKSGFYTNRICFREMIRIFEQAGFICTIPRIKRWEQLPTPREKLYALFHQVADEDLLISGFDILLTK